MPTGMKWGRWANNRMDSVEKLGLKVVVMCSCNGSAVLWKCCKMMECWSVQMPVGSRQHCRRLASLNGPPVAAVYSLPVWPSREHELSVAAKIFSTTGASTFSPVPHLSI